MTTTIITGYTATTVNLTAPAYASPTTIAGTINASGGAVAITSDWSLDITGTLTSDGFFGVFASAPAAITNAGLIHSRSLSGLFLNNASQVTNTAQGTITGGLQGVYSYYKAHVTISNAGTIGSGVAAIKQGFGLIDNKKSGSITGGTIGVTFTQVASLQNAGLVQAQDYGGVGVIMPAGQITNTGTIIGQTAIETAGGIINNAGTIEAETASYGLLAPDAAGTAVSFSAPGLFAEQAGGMVLGSVTGDGGILQVGATYLGGIGQTITGFAIDQFTPGKPGTIGGFAGGFGTVSGFAYGDVVHLAGFYATGGVFNNGVLDLTQAGFFTGAGITFSGTHTTADFNVQINPHGGTDITAACFLAGTLIRTAHGDVPVEALRRGDRLPTLHGGTQPIKWLGRRSYTRRFAANNPDVRPVCITRHALAPGIPQRDLYLSPGHALFIGGHLNAARNLVNGTSILNAPLPEDVHYIHVELNSHEVIVAENAPAESFVNADCRTQFENYVEYLHLFGDAPEPSPSYPRLEDGFALAAIHTRLAGLPPPPAHGPLRGFVEQTGPDRLRGWAQYADQPDVPVCLDILANTRPLARILANRHRADLRATGLGRGFSGFEFPLPDGVRGPFTVRDSASQTSLPTARDVSKQVCAF
jgi:hypothetical protein